MYRPDIQAYIMTIKSIIGFPRRLKRRFSVHTQIFFPYFGAPLNLFRYQSDLTVKTRNIMNCGIFWKTSLFLCKHGTGAQITWKFYSKCCEGNHKGSWLLKFSPSKSPEASGVPAFHVTFFSAWVPSLSTGLCVWKMKAWIKQIQYFHLKKTAL